MTGQPNPSAAQPHAVPALSPSRASDFMQCPLLFRFRVIDKIPERPSAAATRGTLLHAVLERLYALPSESRTPESALALLDPQWQRQLAAQPDLAELFDDEAELTSWLDGARTLLERYFTMEDPRDLEPEQCEMRLEVTLDSGLRLRGYVDRLDVAPTGEVRVVDYKTGKAPSPRFEEKALFQMRCYALMLWRDTGQVPRMLQLMYLGDGQILRYTPEEAELRATERKIAAIWQAVERAARTGDWRPNPTKLCQWCDHQQRCPEFGGTPPTLPWPHPRG